MVNVVSDEERQSAPHSFPHGDHDNLGEDIESFHNPESPMFRSSTGGSRGSQMPLLPGSDNVCISRLSEEGMT